MWGRNDLGQLGTGKGEEEMFVPSPTLLQLNGINRLFTGAFSHHVFIETQDKKYFVFGSNEYKETCVSKCDVVWTPEDVTTKIKVKDEYDVRNIATGLHCSFFLYE